LIGEKETRIGHATIGTLPLAAQLASLKGEANAWLSGESYDALRHRLEDTHASVEAAAVEGGEVQGASVLQDHLQPNQRGSISRPPSGAARLRPPRLVNR
jgi:hypothetical protein